jgi:hypothetical protein
MLTVKKRLTVLGLLLLVALPLFFSAFTFIQQQIIRHQRINRFKTELLETITIKAEKVTWIDEGEEIEVDGNLFDVKSFKKTGNNIVFTGFYDYKEEKLVKHLDELEQQKSKSGSPLNQLTVKFLFFPNYKEHITFSIQNNWQIIVNRYPVYSECIFNMVYPAVIPPPKYC